MHRGRTCIKSGQRHGHRLHVQHHPPKLPSLIPYVVAWIDLDEGPRLLSNVIGSDDDIHIGKRVKLSWEAHNGVNLPLFRAA